MYISISSNSSSSSIIFITIIIIIMIISIIIIIIIMIIISITIIIIITITTPRRAMPIRARASKLNVVEGRARAAMQLLSLLLISLRLLLVWVLLVVTIVDARQRGAADTQCAVHRTHHNVLRLTLHRLARPHACTWTVAFELQRNMIQLMANHTEQDVITPFLSPRRDMADFWFAQDSRNSHPGSDEL